MSRAVAARLRRLEASAQNGRRQIAIWCDEADMEQAIAEVIAAGELRQEERPYCVHWTKADCPPGMHEARPIEASSARDDGSNT